MPQPPNHPTTQPPNHLTWALVGDHPDGVELAEALVASGRHRVSACTMPVGEEFLTRWQARVVRDLEEVLADPAIAGVIVAGRADLRPEQLRRSLQSERHVLCVHPPGAGPEVAYEAALLQTDTRKVLLPILPARTHPALGRLAELITPEEGKSPLGVFLLLEVESSGPEVIEGVGVPGGKPTFPGWEVLRRLGGDVVEVVGFSEDEDLERCNERPVLLSGRFARGGVFQWTLLPGQAARWRLRVVGSGGQAELLFPLGRDGPACLSGPGIQEEYWERWDPWPALVAEIEAHLAKTESSSPSSLPLVSWDETVRALELDDAARRSIERRRGSTLDYQEVSEDVGFKGTMTLVGCGMIWAILLLLIGSRWIPGLGWLVLPVLLVFVALQFLRYLIPARPESQESGDRDQESGIGT